MSDHPVEKRFAVLCGIVRAQHFAWREAVCRSCPDVDPSVAVIRMWENTGKQTAKAYLKRIDRTRALAPQVARSIVSSSESMGEEAAVELPAGKEKGDEAFVRHTSCPWFDWHRRLDLIAEDRPGCDAWFQTLVDEINRELGTRLCVETLETLPEGGDTCLRRLWLEREQG